MTRLGREPVGEKGVYRIMKVHNLVKRRRGPKEPKS